MGEPLSNYEAVRTAVLSMTNPERFGLGRAHVTISTVGVIPRIRQLGTDLPGVSLALSLHAPDQSLRARLVPSARAYPLDRLLDAVRNYQATSRQKVPILMDILSPDLLPYLRQLAPVTRTYCSTYIREY